MITRPHFHVVLQFDTRKSKYIPWIWSLKIESMSTEIEEFIV